MFHCLGIIDEEVEAIGGEEVSEYDGVAEVKHTHHQERKHRVHQVVKVEQRNPYFPAAVVFGSTDAHEVSEDVELGESGPVDPSSSLFEQHIQSMRRVSHSSSLREVSKSVAMRSLADNLQTHDPVFG